MQPHCPTGQRLVECGLHRSRSHHALPQPEAAEHAALMVWADRHPHRPILIRLPRLVYLHRTDARPRFDVPIRLIHIDTQPASDTADPEEVERSFDFPRGNTAVPGNNVCHQDYKRLQCRHPFIRH